VRASCAPAGRSDSTCTRPYSILQLVHFCSRCSIVDLSSLRKRVMSDWLYRLGRRAAARRRLVLAGWILVAVILVLVDRTAGSRTVDDFEVPGVESQQTMDLLRDRFPERSGATAMVVFHTVDGSVTDPEASQGIATTIAEVRSLDHVV